MAKGMLFTGEGALVALALLIGCAAPSSTPADGGAPASDSGTPDGGSPAPDGGTSVEREIGPTGGTLNLGPVRVDVAAGAVGAPTTFRISESTRQPTLPAFTTAVSALYTLTPAAQFSAPVRVSIELPPQERTRVSPGDGLLLMRAPSGTNAFVPVGAAVLDASRVEGQTLEFSDFIVVLFQVANCEVPPPDSCQTASGTSGSCTLTSAGSTYIASCLEQQNGAGVSCTCSTTDSNATPVETGPLSVLGLTGGRYTLTAYTFFTRCGWPCGGDGPDGGSPMADGGVDAGPSDAGPVDGGAADAGPAGEVYASSLYYPDWLYIEGAELFANGGGVTRVNRSTGAFTTLQAWSYPGSLGRVGSYAVDATTVWTTVYDDQTGEGLRLTRFPRTGGSATEVAPGAVLLASDATRIFYVVNGGIYALAKAGGSATKLCDTPALGANGGVVVGGFIYAIGANATLGQLYKIPLAGGDCSLAIANSSGGPSQLLADGTTLYWSHDPAGTIERVTLDGVVSSWTMNQHAVRQLAQDATYIYWSTLVSAVGAPYRWEIRKKAKAGNDVPLPVVQNIVASGEVSGVAVDVTYVYWGDAFSPGALYRAPK